MFLTTWFLLSPAVSIFVLLGPSTSCPKVVGAGLDGVEPSWGRGGATCLEPAGEGPGLEGRWDWSPYGPPTGDEPSGRQMGLCKVKSWLSFPLSLLSLYSLFWVLLTVALSILITFPLFIISPFSVFLAFCQSASLSILFHVKASFCHLFSLKHQPFLSLLFCFCSFLTFSFSFIHSPHIAVSSKIWLFYKELGWGQPGPAFPQVCLDFTPSQTWSGFEGLCWKDG